MCIAMHDFVLSQTANWVPHILLVMGEKYTFVYLNVEHLGIWYIVASKFCEMWVLLFDCEGRMF